MEKLSVLLFNENSNDRTAIIAELPNNLQVLNTLTSNIDLGTHNSQEININQICMVVWLNKDNKYYWCLGYAKNCREYFDRSFIFSK